MDSSRRDAIGSTDVDTPEAAAQLDRFVLDLAERVDLLQDADTAGDLDTLVRLASQLIDQARAVGHEALAGVATRLAEVARQGKAEDGHAGLVELTELAQRVRRGHRGAI
ncbi:MAG: Hpt domain-containing protein [Deltaproteobacteria bacterium]|nr:Hpt domain-containing protein [Deltaproteobacteria bacterium]MBW2362957.1 Hpt domain-containing protein [Deltaproteobacteria bacterium]